MIAADVRLFLWINSLAGRSGILDGLVRVVVNDYFVAVSLALALLGLWFGAQSLAQRERGQRAVICAIVGIGLTSLAIKIMNWFIVRPRPFADYPAAEEAARRFFYLPTDPSFPSNSVAIAFTVAVAVWLGNRRLGGLLFSLAALLALARVYAGVHYPGDVLGGAALGLLIARLSYWLWGLAEPWPSQALKLARKLYLA